jgi:hypothetical protein
MTPMALSCFDTEIVNLNAAQYVRSLSILPWSEARKTSGRPFFAMRNIETLAILYEARESIIPYAQGKINLATARLNFQKSILDLLGKAPDYRFADDDCFNAAARTYASMWSGARNHYGWRD